MRRLILPLLLVVLAVAAATGAYLLEQDDAVAQPPADPVEASATPVLSPRRLPMWLLEPGGDEALRLGLQPVLDQVPADTCLTVSDQGRAILEHNPDLPVVPASNLKTVTAWVAMDVLGGDYTFRTSAVADAPPTDGVINGNLWVVGGGDPVLATDEFQAGQGDPPQTDVETFAQSIVDAGVTTITGDVIGDDSRYDGVDTVPDWPERDYGTAVPGHLDALLVNRGYVSFGLDPEETVVPGVAEDAPASAAQRMLEELEERGVDVQGGSGSGPAPEDGTEVAAITSPPLKDILPVLLRYSDNTASELLVKELAVAEGRSGSTAEGLEVYRSSLERSGFPMEGVVVVDGSGLDGDNRLTCRFLAAMQSSLSTEGAMATSMAVSGESGTLDDRLGGQAEGRIRAKTGSLLETTALSGWAETVVGYDLVFTFIANAPEVPESVLDLEEILASVLVRYPEGPSPADVAPS